MIFAQKEKTYDRRYSAKTPWKAKHKFFIRGEKKGDKEVVAEVFINDTYKVGEITSEPKIVFDIGGHIGSFTVALKSRFPDARVWIVEPHPRSLDLIKKNTAKLEGVNVIHGAVSYTMGARLADSDEATGGGYMTTEKRYKDADDDRYHLIGEAIPIYTVEDLLEIAGVDNVDLVKWDCEGGEVDAFTHMSDRAAGAFGDMVGEFHHPGGYKGFVELAQKRFPNHRFEGRPEEIEDGRHIGWFRGRR